MNSTRAYLRVLRRLLSQLDLRTGWIVLTYGILATLWVLFSDYALRRFVSEPQRLAEWRVYTGIAFVAATSGLLLMMMRRTFGAMAAGYMLLQSQENEIRRLNRLNAALSHINQAIVRLPVRDELFTRICQVLVEHGGFRRASIAWYNPATGQLEPAAAAGYGSNALKNIPGCTDALPENRSPSDRAFRENQIFVCNDILEDPTALPWRETLRSRDFRATVALPIKNDGAARGTLNVYADEPGFFQDKELALLTEVTNDIAFALDNLAREAHRREAEDQLSRMAKQYRELVEHANSIILRWNSEGRITLLNEFGQRFFGYSADEILGRHVVGTIVPSTESSGRDLDRLMKQICEDPKAFEQNVNENIRRDGRHVWISWTNRIQCDPQGRLLGILSIGTDITEQKRANEALRRSEEQFRLIMENLADLVAVLDLEGHRLYASPSYHKILGNPEKLLGSYYLEPVHPDDQPKVKEAFEETVRTGVGRRIDYRLVDQNGEARHIESQSSAIRDAQQHVTQVLTVSRDVTDRRRAELALRVLNQTLQIEVTERTAELRAALVRAEAADRIKSAFLATMSHELRTPLNSIIGFTGIVLQGLAGPLNPEQTKQLSMVRGSARHLLELINDVLDISKIEAGQLEVRCEPFDLVASIDRVTASVKPFADKKGVILQQNIPAGLAEVESDRRRVEQILLNLLNNALKFTDHGSITLSVERIPDHQSSLEIPPRPVLQMRVIDTGIGIRPEDLALLFQPFRQLDTGLTRKHEGTGLGLAICRRLAELLGGEISARSEWQHGSEFTFILPLHKPN